MLEVKVKRLSGNDFPLPEFQTDGSSGVDLYSVDKAHHVEPGNRVLVSTGIAVVIPQGYEGQVRSRSGWAYKSGIIVANSPGTIDSDYRGEIKVILANIGNEKVIINRGERIAQLVFQRMEKVTLKEVDNLPASARDTGGFGSTGK